jgi:uncharacterized membrane protein YfcA
LKRFKKQTIIALLGGAATGFLNGLLGAGGGIVAVPSLKAAGTKGNKAHACSIAVIVPLSAFSAALYLINGSVKLIDALPFVPWGVIGAVLGALVLKKIPSKWLKRIFGVFVLWAGVRLLMK